MRLGRGRLGSVRFGRVRLGRVSRETKRNRRKLAKKEQYMGKLQRRSMKGEE